MAAWESRKCRANGIEIHYLRTGGNKSPLILLHGLMTSGACWSPMARALQEHYDVIMPDARGHGKSSVPEKGYSYKTLAADVIALIDELGLSTPLLLGHSMGGMTAALVASQNRKRLGGLVLADPTFLTPERQREVYESDVVGQHRKILKRSKEDLLLEMQTRPRPRSSEMIELLAEARFQTSIHAFEVLTPPNPDYMQLIKLIDVPILLVFGDIGSIVSHQMATELSFLNERLKIVEINEAGHGMPYDHPERLSAVILTFLQSLVP